MNPSQLILILDAASLITCIWCFDAMAQGRSRGRSLGQTAGNIY